MSVGAVPSNSNSVVDLSASSVFDQTRQAWKDLESNLKSGNLDAAKQAYDMIVKMHTQMVNQSGKAERNSRADRDMEALGSALGTRNLAAAHQSLATMQKNVRKQPVPQAPPSQGARSTDAIIADWRKQTESGGSRPDGLSQLMNEPSGKNLNVMA